MNPPWLAWPETQDLIKAFAAGNAELRFVGGAVRDALLDRPVQDVDAATPLLPKAVILLLEKAYIKAIPTGIDHGTVTAVIGTRHFEITTLRKDTACDGRHAEVTFTDDWREDAKRRDFTMNALYLSPSGELFDYFGGETDAEAGRVRFIGDPQQRIAEDYLRILRFFRFHAWYGKGDADPEAVAACSALASHMETLSGERIQAELLKLLAVSMHACCKTLEIMRSSKVLDNVIGTEPHHDDDMCHGLTLIEEKTGIIVPAAIKLLMFVPVMSKVAENVLNTMSQRLRLPNKITAQLSILLKHIYQFRADLSESEQKRLLRRLGKQLFECTVIIKWSLDSEPVFKSHPYDRMLSLAGHWQPPQFPVTGDDLIALGISPGKNMGMLLRQLEDEWETNDYKTSKEELLRGAKQNK